MIKKNTRLKGLIMVLGITVLVGCSATKHETNIDLNKVKEENRINAPDIRVEDFEALLYPYTKEEANKELYQYVDIAVVPEFITKEEAINEVKYFFNVMKYGYSAYQFFGGNSKFQEAEQMILDEIQHYQRIDRQSLKNIMIKNLAFIKDTHFNIEGGGVTNVQLYISYDAWDLYEDQEGYYFIEDKEKYYIKKINDEAVEKYIKPSISKDGKLIYRIGFLREYVKEIDNGILLKVHTQKGKYNQIKSVICKTDKVEFNKNQNNKTRVYETEGIPVLEIKSFEIEENQEWISETLDKVRKSPVFIIDLRGNRGGYKTACDQWIYNFTYKPPKSNGFKASLETDTTRKIVTGNKEKTDTVYYRGNNRGWVDIEKPYQGIDKNDYRIYILVDKATASAAETMIQRLRTLENITVVGTNTFGSTVTGNIREWYLPHSKLKIRSGVDFSLDGDLINRDGIGILPDLWVKSPDALLNTIKYIN